MTSGARAGRLGPLFMALLVFGTTAAAAAKVPDKLDLIETLRQGDFAALEDQLGALQSAYEASTTSDAPLDVAFNAFRNTSPDLEPRLDAWVAANPDSGAARLARGVFHATVGWHLRGARTVARTQEESFARMRARFARSEADLEAAIARNPRLAAAYDHLIGIHMARNQESDVHRVFRNGIVANPGSVAIRSSYYGSLRPRWNNGPVSVALFDRLLDHRDPLFGPRGKVEGLAQPPIAECQTRRERNRARAERSAHRAARNGQPASCTVRARGPRKPAISRLVVIDGTQGSDG